MPLQTLATTLAAAERGGYAVGAFNVSDLNQAIAVLDAARAERSPVIVQTIAGASAYSDESWWWHMLRTVLESYADVTATLHLDHGRTLEDCIRAMDHGFTSVMIDASRSTEDDEPNDFESNVAVTKSVVDVAHARGVSVEGELGTIGGAEAGMTGVIEEIVYADPSQAEEFVVRTGVDALAVAVGTSHGSVKFTDESGGQRLRINLIAEIKNASPHRPVLHGSSSIPVDAVEAINKQGGSVTPSTASTQRRSRQALRRASARSIRALIHTWLGPRHCGPNSANVHPRSSPVRQSLPRWRHERHHPRADA